MTETPVTVFVHVHYPDVWQGMSERLVARMTQPFRLVLTSSHPESAIVRPASPSLLSTRFVPVENRGRDILPFLRALAATEDFEFGLKLHTKKSPQRDDGAQWLAEVLNSLVPPDDGAGGLVERIRADRRVGLVTPTGFCLSVKPWILQNAPGMERVMATVGGDLSDTSLQDAYFAAGSMFWFRRPALAGLANEQLMAMFEPEEGQLDGTIAHAMERIFPLEARHQGYVSLAASALAASRPSMSDPELLALARHHADIPSSYFPAPYVAALPPAPIVVPEIPQVRSRVSTLFSPEHLSLTTRRVLRRLLR